MIRAYVLIFFCCFSASFCDTSSDDDLDTKIIGGEAATEGEFPFIVSLQAEKDGKSFKFCGGSILRVSWILTAAHCIDQYRDSNATRMYIKAGAVDAGFTPDRQALYVNVKRQIKHPQYSGPFNENDIALLELETPIVFTKRVQPVALPPQGYNPVGTGTLLGWGATANPAPKNQARFLNKVIVPITPKEECSEIYPELTKKQICPGTAGKGACGGDSGGPLLQVLGGHRIVAGVDSYSKRPCGMFPSIYVKVSAFVDDFLIPTMG